MTFEYEEEHLDLNELTNKELDLLYNELCISVIQMEAAGMETDGLEQTIDIIGKEILRREQFN